MGKRKRGIYERNSDLFRKFILKHEKVDFL